MKSAISHQPSAVSRQPSAIGHQPFLRNLFHLVPEQRQRDPPPMGLPLRQRLGQVQALLERAAAGSRSEDREKTV